MIDRSIAEKCDFIEIPKFAQDVFADTLGSNPLLILSPFILESIDDIFEFIRIYTPLREGLHHGVYDLRAVIWLALS
jgi:hypothetical protein